MGTKKGQRRKTARRAYEPKKKKRKSPRQTGWLDASWDWPSVFDLRQRRMYSAGGWRYRERGGKVQMKWMRAWRRK